MTVEREVAGIRCGEVLARLSDYLDDELPMSERRRVEAHLRGCDVCERFGGEMAELVALLRRHLAAEDASRRGSLWAERVLGRIQDGTPGGPGDR